MALKDKRIVITGAASGIGAALLRRLAAYDCQIVAADLNPVDIDALGNNIKAQVHSMACDLSLQTEVDKLFDYAEEIMGGVDVFIANAGFAYYEQITQADWERMAQIYRVNVFSPLYSLGKMLESHPQVPFSVVITCSAMSRLGLAGYAHYGATKAALDRFAESFRLEKPTHCHLMLVYPIATRTAFFNKGDALYPSQTADYVARRVMQGLIQQRDTVHPSPGFTLMQFLRGLMPFLPKVYQRYSLWHFKPWQKRSLH